MASAAEHIADSADFDAAALGADIRGLRKSRSLTLAELALKIGRSVGFISQIERGLSSPSIDDLRSLAAALDVPISWFFAVEPLTEAERGVVMRAEHRRQLGSREGGLVEELLSPDLGGNYEMLRCEFAPGAVMDEPVLRETEESGVIIEGELDLWIDGAHFHLEAGDSFRFDHKPYRWANRGETTTVAVWVVSPPVY
ncbi:MAG: helix-turn-helix domain-containing protein [Pseudomonadota bacterium]